MEVRYGIACLILQRWVDYKEVLSEKSFTFHFDESTTSQTKKQYDCYVKFFSLESGEAVIAYCWTLFVGRFSALGMVNHPKTFGAKQNLDV